jgi:hypothetical protein
MLFSKTVTESGSAITGQKTRIFPFIGTVEMVGNRSIFKA